MGRCVMFTMLTGKQNTLNYWFRTLKLIKFMCLVMIVSIRNMIFAYKSSSCSNRFANEWKNLGEIPVRNIKGTFNPCFIECIYFKKKVHPIAHWMAYYGIYESRICVSIKWYKTLDVMHIFMVYRVTNKNVKKTFVFSWRWSCLRWQHRSALLVRVRKRGLVCARFGHKYKETNVRKDCGLQNSYEDLWNKYIIKTKTPRKT